MAMSKEAAALFETKGIILRRCAMGFDSGIANFGWAVIKQHGEFYEVEFGTIKTDKADEYRWRMFHIAKEVVALIYKHEPQKVGIEQIMLRIVSKPVLYAFAAAQIVIHECMKYGLGAAMQVQEVNPMELKKWFCKNAKADKQEMVETVKVKYPIKGRKINEHEADAVALAAYSMGH